MDASTVFDRLSAQLNDQERRQMLASIRQSMESAAFPIAGEEDGEPLPIEQQVSVMPLWRRVLLFLVQLFTGREREDIVRDWIVRDIEQDVQRDVGNAVDGRKRVFTEEFAAELEQLRDAAGHLRPVFQTLSVHRTELVLALAIDLFPTVHHELMQRTGEDYIESLNEESERYLKRVLSDFLEDSLQEIPPDARAELRRALAQGDELLRLTSIPFQSMIDSFEAIEGVGRRVTFDYVGRHLTELYQVSAQLRRPLDMRMLETVLLLHRAENRPEGPEEDYDSFQEAFRSELQAMLDALAVFREFIERYPLVGIIRMIKDDPWWIVDPQPGGEDWISLYRAFFVDRIHRQVLRVSLRTQLRSRLADLRDACATKPRPLTGLPDGSNGPRTKHWYLGTALRTFVSSLWRDALPNLRIILTSGEFYKSSNRAQFNDAYNDYEAIPDRVEKLEHDLKPDEAWGAMLASSHDPSQRKKMVDRVDTELLTLYEDVRTTVEVIVNVLGGILYARAGSSYDTLANFGQIGGRRNAELIGEMKDMFRRLSTFLGSLGEIHSLERRAADNELRLEMKDEHTPAEGRSEPGSRASAG